MFQLLAGKNNLQVKQFGHVSDSIQYIISVADLFTHVALAKSTIESLLEIHKQLLQVEGTSLCCAVLIMIKIIKMSPVRVFQVRSCLRTR